MKKLLLLVFCLSLVGCQYLPSKEEDLKKISELQGKIDYQYNIDSCLKEAETKRNGGKTIVEIMQAAPDEEMTETRNAIRKCLTEFTEEQIDMISQVPEATRRYFSDVEYCESMKKIDLEYESNKKMCLERYK